MRSSLVPVLPSLVLSALAGCGPPTKPDNAVPIFAVKGTLTYGNTAMAGAVVTFHPVTENGVRTIAPSATADEQGRYALTTYLSKDGAPAGDYRVTIYWPEAVPANRPVSEADPDLPPDRLRQVYANAKTTTLRATVHKQANTIDFTLP